MTKQEYFEISVTNGIKFKSKLDNVDGMPKSKKIWTCNGMSVLFVDLCLHTMENNDAYPVRLCTPIVRHLSDLTKECVQADYNDGKPFIPILELANIASCSTPWTSVSDGSVESSNGIVFYFNENSFDFVLYDHWRDFHVSIDFQLKLFQQLIKWHFDLITEKCSKVYVTEEFNPYK